MYPVLIPQKFFGFGLASCQRPHWINSGQSTRFQPRGYFRQGADFRCDSESAISSDRLAADSIVAASIRPSSSVIF
jgi:hypothetical protein